jgi:DNA-binding PadR family transcriptional regulator
MSSPKESIPEQGPRESKAFLRLEKNLTIDLLWIWILKLLKSEPKYAYQLKQEIQEKFGFSPATVTNYTILYLLEREGLVEKTEISNNVERIDRKYYIITKFGEEVMDEAESYLAEIYKKLFSKEAEK